MNLLLSLIEKRMKKTLVINNVAINNVDENRDDNGDLKEEDKIMAEIDTKFYISRSLYEDYHSDDKRCLRALCYTYSDFISNKIRRCNDKDKLKKYLEEIKSFYLDFNKEDEEKKNEEDEKKKNDFLELEAEFEKFKENLKVFGEKLNSMC